MTRLHRDPVQVRTCDGEPEQFLWHGRLYVVQEVLSRWTESGGWWQGEQLRALSTGDSAGAVLPAALETAALPASPKWAQRAWGEPAPEVGVALGGLGIDDRECTWWRVEAGAGRFAGTGVYDLCFAWTGGPSGTGGWSLARVLD